MKQWLKDIWHDPVWSKVIASLIMLLLGALYAFIKSLVDDETFVDAIQQVSSYKVNIWLAAGIALFIWIVLSVFRNRLRYYNRVPQLPFVDDFTWGVYQGQKWVWRWQWSKTNNFYYITDLSIVCPACKEGLLTLGYMDYKCGKCGADIPYNWLNTTNDAVEKQILEDARKKYNFCAEYLGKFPQNIVKG